MIKIYVCGNHECLANYEDAEAFGDDIDAAVSAVCSFIDGAESIDDRVDSVVDRHFSNWNGGKFYQAGSKIGETQFGYKCGHIATLVRDPSPELISLIDRAADLLADRLAAIEAKQSA